MCIALAGGVDGCDKFSGWQQAMEMEREIVIPPQKKRWWYKVTKNPMVVFFSNSISSQKPHILTENGHGSAPFCTMRHKGHKFN